MSENKPIFILGVQRSGTTLLTYMLDSHPNIAIGRETTVMSAMHRLYGDFGKSDNPAEKLWTDWYERYGLNRAEFSVYVRNFLQTFFDDYAKKNGKSRWGEKTPTHIHYASLIYDIFPEAQVIHIVRDPRAVCASRQGWRGSIEGFAKEWEDGNLGLLEFSKQLTSDQYYRIRYEDLVADPEKYGREIISFLGEPWNDAVLSHEKIVTDRFAAHDPSKGANILENKKIDGKIIAEGGKANDPSRSIDQASVNKWMKKLRKKDIALVQKVAAEGMKKFGYRKATGLIPLIGKIQLAGV